MNKTTAAAAYVLDRVNGLRRLRGWSWKEVAKQTGISLSRVYNITGYRGSPISIDEMVTFAEAFGLAPSALLPPVTDENVQLNTDALLKLLQDTPTLLLGDTQDGD